MTPETVVLFALAVPFVGAGLVIYFGFAPNARETMSLLSGAALFALVASLYPAVMAGARPEVTLLEMFPGLSVTFTVEPLGLLFALVASFLWIVTTLYAIGYMRGHHERNQTRFFFFFAIAIFAAIGVAFAGNLLTLFIFYEVLTFSTFPLVTHHGSETAKRGGRVYLGILVGTSIAFLFLAIAWTWVAAGTLDFRPGGILAGKVEGPAVAVLLGLFAFGIGKAALMPFHRWLPAAMVAPTPVSALLHAVAVVKAGVFSVLKVAIYVFGIDFLSETGASEWLQYVAAATIVIASLVAMSKDNLKARLAYSTISQLSYIVLGAMLANQIGAIGGGLHIATHAFGKITLFFCAGAIMVATHKTEISQMKGLGRTMPFTMFAFLIGALSIIGLPPFAGVWSKWYLVLGALEAHQLILVGVLLVSSLLNVAYLLPIPLRGFFSDPDPVHEEAHPGVGHGHPEAHAGEVSRWEAPLPSLIAIGLTATGCLALFLWPDPVYALLTRLVTP